MQGLSHLMTASLTRVEWHRAYHSHNHAGPEPCLGAQDTNLSGKPCRNRPSPPDPIYWVGQRELNVTYGGAAG